MSKSARQQRLEAALAEEQTNLQTLADLIDRHPEKLSLERCKTRSEKIVADTQREIEREEAMAGMTEEEKIYLDLMGDDLPQRVQLHRELKAMDIPAAVKKKLLQRVN